MKGARLIACVCLVLGLAEGTAHAQDSFWGTDKALHLGVSILLSLGGYAGASLVLDEPWQRAVAAAGFSLGVGAAKEGVDALGYGDPSLRDFAWDGIGTGVGVGIGLSVDLSGVWADAARAEP